MREKPVSYDLKNIFLFALQKYTFICENEQPQPNQMF